MKTSLFRSFVVLTACGLLPACADPELGRALDQGDRAGGDFCVEGGSVAAQGILELVNDPTIDMELLDRAVSEGGAGLYRNAAENIVAARPIADLDQLDAVPYVGMSACESLARFACNEQDRCRKPLEMVTWNIEHFPLGDQTEDAVVELVEDMQPAVIGVQEIEDREAFARLVDRLEDYEGILAERGFFNRVGVLYRTSDLEVVGTEDLFVDDSYTFPRSVLATTFDVLGAGEPTTVTFAVVHLKAFGDSESVERRRAAVEDLRGWVDERRGQGQGSIVIVGDWNDKLTDEGDKNVFVKLSEASAQAQFVTLETAEAGHSSYVPFPSLIDHILVTDEVFDALDYQGTEVLYLDQTWSSDYETVVSDHRPVQATFDVVQRYE